MAATNSGDGSRTHRPYLGSRRTTFVSRPSSQGLKPVSRLRGTAPRFLAWVIRHPGWPRREGVQPVEITGGYCWPTSFKVLGVLFLGEVSPAFLPSKKACWTRIFRHLGVGQQYPGVYVWCIRPSCLWTWTTSSGHF